MKWFDYTFPKDIFPSHDLPLIFAVNSEFHWYGNGT